MFDASRKSKSASPTWSGSLRDVKTPQAIMTIGHSTRAIDDFIDLLKDRGIKRRVDVRKVPRSRHNPQFNADELPHALGIAHISYTHMPELGGLRHGRKDSLNT